VGRDERLWDGAGLIPIKPRRNAGDRIFMNGQQLGVRAATNDSEDPVAGLPSRGSRSRAHDLAGEFHSRNVRRTALWRRIATHSLKQIGPIQRARVNADQDLAVRRHWIRNFLQL
jgi:hypothetical protein